VPPVIFPKLENATLVGVVPALLAEICQFPPAFVPVIEFVDAYVEGPTIELILLNVPPIAVADAAYRSIFTKAP